MEVISLSITCIKHESSNTSDDTKYFTTQKNTSKTQTSPVSIQTNVSQPSNMESSMKKEENVGHVTSSPSLGDGLVALKHTAQEEKNKNEKCHMDRILPGMSDEKANKSENTINNAENGECSERSLDFYNQKESKKNTDAVPETDAEEKDVKEAFTIIKWEAPLHDKTEKCFCDTCNLNRQATEMDNTNSLISSPLLSDGMVTLKHGKGGGERSMEKYLGHMGNSQPGMLEETEIKSEQCINDSNNGGSFERNNEFYNQKELREDNEINSETTVEKNLKEGFTKIKWEGCRFDKTENDNLIQLNTREVDTNSVNVDIDNDSHITIVKYNSLKANDSQIKNNSQKRPSTSRIFPGKQPVVILKRLKMKDGSNSCDYSKTTGKDPSDEVYSSEVKIERKDDEQTFIETSEQGMFLRNISDTEGPVKTSSSVKEEKKDAGTDQCEFDLSQEMKDEIQSAIQTNIEAMVISNQTSNGEGFSYVYPYACGQCNYTAKLQHHLKNHMKIHSTDRPFVCDVCGKGFKHDHHLNGHKRTHSGERPYSCEECGRDFTQISNLLRHQKTHQGLPESPRHKCLKCDTSFSTAYSLKRHQDVHENLKEKVKTMKNHKGKKKKLTYNPRIDDTRREFECDVCGRRFRRKEHVMRHMLTHTGESAVHIHACEVCDKKCGSKRALENHIKIHTGDDIDIDSMSSTDESDSEEEFESD
ncbi:zinc finger protein 845-like [Saccostrea cucullata]|uniref:zinc finger protein 845-like n=1 Tax=Saccostrea cuccullata TaxID=36930 RepID=UPI002ED6BBC5